MHDDELSVLIAVGDDFPAIGFAHEEVEAFALTNGTGALFGGLHGTIGVLEVGFAAAGFAGVIEHGDGTIA